MEETQKSVQDAWKHYCLMLQALSSDIKYHQISSTLRGKISQMRSN